jgi:hypothetical protein
MTGNYAVVRWAFIFTIVSGAITAYVFLVIISKIARFAWTAVTCLILSLLLLILYENLCPTFLIEPSILSFNSNDLYLLRVTNKTDGDEYANAFIINVDSHLYTAGNFDLRVERQFLKPLAPQSTDLRQRVSDTFGVSGLLNDPPGDAFLIYYVYHLAPHESREINLKFNGVIAKNAPAKISMDVMSYSDVPVPISQKDDVVMVPVRIKKNMTVDREFHCSLQGDDSNLCMFQPIPKATAMAKGCYLIAFSASHLLPNQGSLDDGCTIK